MAGETGLVGRAVLRALGRRSDIRLLSAPRSTLDLTNQKETYEWIGDHKPDVIIMAAARVGGIGANASYPADFIRDNLAIALNTIEGARRADAGRFLFLGSSCIYPKMAPQPIREDALLTGPLEETNEAYAIAKIAGLKLCQHYRTQYGLPYICAMPTNLYGPYDRFDREQSHVIPAMMMKIAQAIEEGRKTLTLWGTGAPLREFLHVDDLAAALIVMLEHYDGAAPVNIGSGEEIGIAALARKIAGVAGFTGDIRFDPTQPDGTMRKCLDSSKMRALGWKPSVSLEEGLAETWNWFRAQASQRKVA